MIGGIGRPQPGPETGAMLTFGDVTLAVWIKQGSPGATNFISWEATSILHGHSEGSKGSLDPHAWPFSGLACSSRYSQLVLRATDSRGCG